MLDILYRTHIAVEGLWLNADKAFECDALRQVCIRHDIELNAPHNRRRALSIEDELPYFDDLMYDERYKIERINAWMDNYRSLGLRFDKTIHSWNAWHYIFCIMQWIKKYQKFKSVDC